MEAAGVRRVLVIVKEELAAGIEPVETIGHHRARWSGCGERVLAQRRPGLGGGWEICWRLIVGGRWFWPARSSCPVHRRLPACSWTDAADALSVLHVTDPWRCRSEEAAGRGVDKDALGAATAGRTDVVVMD